MAFWCAWPSGMACAAFTTQVEEHLAQPALVAMTEGTGPKSLCSRARWRISLAAIITTESSTWCTSTGARRSSSGRENVLSWRTICRTRSAPS